MKKIILSIALAYSGYASAQVGIGTDNPRATLDITSDGTFSVPNGLLIPRISRIVAAAVTTDNSSTTPEESTLIYVNDITGDIPADGVASNIDAKGFYYYSRVNSKWMKIYNNPDGRDNLRVYNFDNGLTPISNGNLINVKLGGQLKENTFIAADENKTLQITGNVENLFSVDNTTFSVDGGNNRVGIGTITPQAKLHLTKDINDTNEILRIVDGNQANGKVLTSDADGNASWQTVSGSNALVNANNGLTSLSIDGVSTVQLGGELDKTTTLNISENASDARLTITGNKENMFSVDGSTFSVDGSKNSVGIGTNSPQKSLHVSGTGLQLSSPLFVGTGNPGAIGQVLVSNGPNGSPTWEDISAGGGTVNLAAVGTNGVSVSTNDGTATIKLGGTLSELTTLNIPDNNPNAKLEITGGGVNTFSVQSDVLTNLSVDNANNRVGIGTETPKATLDIQARFPSGYYPDVTEGLLIPRVGRDRANDMRDVQTSTLIYVDRLVGGGSSAKVQYIDEVGFYYFDGTYWVKLKGEDTNTTYNANNGLTLNGNTIQLGGELNQSTSIDAKSNVFKVTGTSTNDDVLVVNGANKKIGVGVTDPTNTLDVGGDLRIRTLGESSNPGSLLTVDSNGVVQKTNNDFGTYFLGGTVYVNYDTTTGGNTSIPTISGSYSVGGINRNGSIGGIRVIKGNGYKISNPGQGIFDIEFDVPFREIYGISVNIVDSYRGSQGGSQSNKNPFENEAGTALKTNDNTQVSFISNSIISIKTGNSEGTNSNRSFTFLVTGK